MGLRFLPFRTCTLANGLKAALGLLVALATATSAVAQVGPPTPRMTCAKAKTLVAARGAIVLATGAYTFDRFVAHAGFCLITETTRPEWVPTADTPQCFVGYSCKEKSLFIDH